MSYSSTQSIVSSTFSKVVLHAQWRGQGRVALGSALSFVSFSLGLFLQRKAAKPFWYQDLLNAFSFATRGTNLSCLTYVSHLLAQNRKAKRWTKQSIGCCYNSPINQNLKVKTAPDGYGFAFDFLIIQSQAPYIPVLQR